MITNSYKDIHDIDLDEQLEETQKLKQCILEFSTRLQKAQERLLEEDSSKKIKHSLMMTQKVQISRPRRHNSQNPCVESFHSRKPSKISLTNENLEEHVCIPQEMATALSSNVIRSTPKHCRKFSEFHEDPHEKFASLQLPISPSLAYRYFKYLLSPFEQGEVLEYNEIYFLGLSAQKTKSYSVNMNYGYDDERGDYLITTGDHIAYRYEIIKFLGKGSFGQVVQVFDHKSKEHLALKIIRNRPRFHQQAEIEVKVLRSLMENDKSDKFNIVRLKETLTFRSHTCITFEMLGCSLYDLLKSNNFKGLSTRHIRRYSHQILQSLYLLSKLKLIHCDLKPENILISKSTKSSVKVIDFGSSCHRNNRSFTYIQSRFYRAPEVILGLEYGEAIDVWSFGCILVELYTGHPLFPGENEPDLFNCMMEVLGVPPEGFIEGSAKKNMFFNTKNEPRIIPNSKGKKRYPGARNLDEIMNGADMEFIDLVESKGYLDCLQWEPEKRITARNALEHFWFQNRNRGLCTGPTTKGHRYHLSDTQFNHSSYNRIFHPPQSAKFYEKGFAF